MRQAPAGACDCAIHIYRDGAPLGPNASRPGPAWATVEAYREVQRALCLSRTVIVQPTAYGLDNTVTLSAVEELGRDAARAVVVVDESVSHQELQRLTNSGACGARFQMLPGGALGWDALEPVARLVAFHGWHIQLQMDGRILHEREAMLRRLPCPLVIDHIGKFLEPVSVSHPGFLALLLLLDSGRCWLKLSAPYEVSRSGPPDYADVGSLAKVAAAAAPDRMLWGSNWPHVSSLDNLPDDARLLALLTDWTEDEAQADRILVENPAELYGFKATP